MSHICGDSGHREHLKESRYKSILTIQQDEKIIGEKWSNDKKLLGIHTDVDKGYGFLPVERGGGEVKTTY